MNTTEILTHAARSYGFWLGRKQRMKRKYPEHPQFVAFDDGAAFSSLQILQVHMPKSRALRRSLGTAIRSNIKLFTEKATAA